MIAKQLIRQAPTIRRGFKTFAPVQVKVGDKIPSIELQETAPSNKVNLANETQSGKSIIVGVPGAFSPACSAAHVPGYIQNFKQLQKKGIDNVYVVTVNDAFVTGEWAKALGAGEGSGVRVLADSDGSFTNQLDLSFDASAFFGNSRSKRCAVVVENGKVVQTFVEPDNVSVDVSAAEKVLQNL